MNRRILISMVFIVLVALVATACFRIGGHEEKASFPSSNTIEIIAPANTGGGWDSTARALVKVISDNNIADDVNFVVTNKPGSKGSVGWNYVIERKDSHIVAMDSSYIYLNQLLGVEGAQSLDDFTPIYTITNEWIGVFVKADSEMESINTVVDSLRNDPTSIRVAIAPDKGNDDHMSVMSIVKAAGVDVEAFDENIIATTTGELIPGLLGGFYDVVVTGAVDGLEFMNSGDLRCIAVTSGTRMPGNFADVPTVKESGIDVVFPHWRGILGHSNMSAEEIIWWENIIEQAIETDQWQSIMRNNSWEPFYKDSKETREMWEEEYEVYKSLVNNLGLVE